MEELKVIVHEASARGKAVMAHAEGTLGDQERYSSRGVVGGTRLCP